MCSKLNSVEKSLQELKSVIRGASNGFGTHLTPGDDAGDFSDDPSRLPMDSMARHMSMEGIHTRNKITGESVHIGGSSVPAMIMTLGRDTNGATAKEVLGKDILPLFGLDNESATYPFVDLWGLPHGSMTRVHELCKAIPNDSECLNFFRYYKDTSHVVYPGNVDINKFESDLLMFLINRASLQPNTDGDNGVNEQSIYGKSVVWVGLLFAALASGCQCSSLPRKERELTSSVFACCSFECLRFTNFLTYATIESIQTLLVLGNVVSNNMNAGVAWSLLGLTIRLAQTLGLHRQCPASTPIETKIVRSKTWWAVVWQDSLLSISYDRASSAATLDRPAYLPPGTSSTAGNRSYEESMYRLCRVGLDIVRERANPNKSHDDLIRVTEHRSELQEIMFEAADYLKDSRRCRSIRDQLEHWALYLHVSYITAELCRPAISPSTAHFDLSKQLRKTCLESLANTVEAFLGLQNVTPFANRSWAAIHRALSSALLLGILKEHLRNDRVRALLHKMVAVMSDVTSTVDPAELATPITRSIAALRKLTQTENKPSAPQSQEPTSTATPADSGFAMDPSLTGPSMDFNDPNFFSLSPIMSFGSEDSPYALMDTIIWGGANNNRSPKDQVLPAA